MNRSITAIVPVLLAPLVAQAGVIRHDRDDSLYRGLADEPQYASSLAIHSGGQPHCSGTLVARDWILIAGHCTLAPDLTAVLGDGRSFSVAEVVVHPDYEPNQVSMDDLALLRLDLPVSGLTPAVRYRGDDEIGHVATSVGYGATGDGLIGVVADGGTRRAGRNVIDSEDFLFGTEDTLMTDFDNPLDPGFSLIGDATPLDLEYLPAPGDSGGSMFIDVGGQTMLAGVHTAVGLLGRIPNHFFTYGDVLLFERVSRYNDWIDGVIPEPSPIALLAVGALFKLRRR